MSKDNKNENSLFHTNTSASSIIPTLLKALPFALLAVLLLVLSAVLYDEVSSKPRQLRGLIFALGNVTNIFAICLAVTGAIWLFGVFVLKQKVQTFESTLTQLFPGAVCILAAGALKGGFGTLAFAGFLAFCYHTFLRGNTSQDEPKSKASDEGQ